MKLFKTAFAHCDIPCGIYSEIPSKLAAATVLRMVKKIKELPKEDWNNFVRMVQTKEEHAQICKKEILILWTDYFKDEHFEKYPDLTDKVRAVCKLCSENKQNVDEKLAEDLVKAVDEIADIFTETKK